MLAVDLEPLRKEIRRRHLMEAWSDTLFPISKEERIARAHKRALEARDIYIRLMSSKRNDRSPKYQDWALKKALGLRTFRGYTAQAIGGRHWRAWGKKEDVRDVPIVGDPKF